MMQNYILGIDIAKHKNRFALCDEAQRFLGQGDLAVTRAGLQELLSIIQCHVLDPAALLVVMEATGVLHLNWAAALCKAGYAVMVLNPLATRRLYMPKNSIRDNKTDPVMRVACARSAACTGRSCLNFIAFKASQSGSLCNGSKRCANNCAAP